jgi:hypothetical protein
MGIIRSFNGSAHRAGGRIAGVVNQPLEDGRRRDPRERITP